MSNLNGSSGDDVNDGGSKSRLALVTTVISGRPCFLYAAWRPHLLPIDILREADKSGVLSVEFLHVGQEEIVDSIGGEQGWIGIVAGSGDLADGFLSSGDIVVWTKIIL